MDADVDRADIDGAGARQRRMDSCAVGHVEGEVAGSSPETSEGRQGRGDLLCGEQTAQLAVESSRSHALARVREPLPDGATLRPQVEGEGLRFRPVQRRAAGQEEAAATEALGELLDHARRDAAGAATHQPGGRRSKAWGCENRRPCHGVERLEARGRHAKLPGRVGAQGGIQGSVETGSVQACDVGEARPDVWPLSVQRLGEPGERSDERRRLRRGVPPEGPAATNQGQPPTGSGASVGLGPREESRERALWRLAGVERSDHPVTAHELVHNVSASRGEVGANAGRRVTVAENRDPTIRDRLGPARQGPGRRCSDLRQTEATEATRVMGRWLLGRPSRLDQPQDAVDDLGDRGLLAGHILKPLPVGVLDEPLLAARAAPPQTDRQLAAKARGEAEGVVGVEGRAVREPQRAELLVGLGQVRDRGSHLALQHERREDVLEACAHDVAGVALRVGDHELVRVLAERAPHHRDLGLGRPSSGRRERLVADEDTPAGQVLVGHRPALAHVRDEGAEAVGQVVDVEPGRVERAASEVGAEVVGVRHDAALRRCLGGLQDRSRRAGAEDRTAAAAVERQGRAADVALGRRGAGGQEARAHPRHHRLVGHVVGSDDDDPTAAPELQPVGGEAQRLSEGGAGGVDAGVRPAGPDDLGHPGVPHPHRLEDEAAVEGEVGVRGGAVGVVDADVDAREGAGEDDASVVTHARRQRPARHQLPTALGRLDLRDQRQPGVPHRLETGGDRQLARPVQAGAVALRQPELGQREAAQAPGEPDRLGALRDRLEDRLARWGLAEAGDVLGEDRVDRRVRQLGDEVVSAEQAVQVAVLERDLAARDPGAEARADDLGGVLPDGVEGAGRRLLGPTDSRRRFFGQTRHDVLGERGQGRELGQAEVGVTLQPIDRADLAHDLGLLDRVDAKVGLELEVGLDLVGVVTRSVA